MALSAFKRCSLAHFSVCKRGCHRSLPSSPSALYRVEVRTAPTSDQSKLLRDLHGLEAGGKSHFVTSVKIAMLALKHRKNRAGDSRVIIFVGSPVNATEKRMRMLGNQLRKSNVALDVVAMGENDDNEGLLRTFVNAAHNEALDNCHLVLVPEGQVPYDVVTTSPILGMGGAGGGAMTGGGNMDDLMEEDPELAIALRQSMEESRQQGEAAATEGPPAAEVPKTTGEGADAEDAGDEEDEAAMLARAIAMSMNAEGEGDGGDGGDADMGEDSAPAATGAETATPAASAPESSAAGGSGEGGAGSAPVYDDPVFVNEMLSGLVDMNDPAIAAALELAAKAADEDGKESEGKDEEGKDGK